MTAPDGLIRIPLNEESGKGGAGQIEEFLMQYNGEGIQHIALLTDDLIASVDALQMAGVPLMSAPNDVYYEMLQERLPGHGEPVVALQARGILLDGTTAGGDNRLLLQIFSQPLLGPVFFEFIQRKRDEGFGEGNFKALFESLERDQIRRGALVMAREFRDKRSYLVRNNDAKPRVLVIDMSRVPDVEYSALQALIEDERRATQSGVVLWLVGLNPRVLEVVRNAGLAERLGRDRMLFNARIAIERYQALQAAGAGSQRPEAS
jgi:anti-anti-sigma regulatory factor